MKSQPRSLRLVAAVAVACDHSYDAQIKSPFEPVSSEQSRLDMFIARVHSMAYYQTKSRGRMAAESNRQQLGSRPRQARHYRPCGAVQNRGYLLNKTGPRTRATGLLREIQL
jgi:enoyl-[acyl-carrier-protein] reductase (NADH)